MKINKLRSYNERMVSNYQIINDEIMYEDYFGKKLHQFEEEK